MSNLSILIHKDSSAEFPYMLFDNGIQVAEFTTLDEARQFIVTEYHYPDDPTRFFFHTPESGSKQASETEYSLDLIAINVCAEGRVLEFITLMLMEKSPQHHEEIIAKTAQKLNLSPILVDCVLLRHCGIYGRFWDLHPYIYLGSPGKADTP